MYTLPPVSLLQLVHQADTKLLKPVPVFSKTFSGNNALLQSNIVMTLIYLSHHTSRQFCKALMTYSSFTIFFLVFRA